MHLFAKTDLKYTLRQISKSPGFALLSIIVLAGGLGLSLFSFSFIYTMAYKAVDLPDGDRIVEICGEGNFGSCRPIKAFEFASIRDDITTLENIGVYTAYELYVQSDEVFREASITQTEWNMFRFLPEGAFLGRALQQTDQDAGAEAVAVISHDFWQLAFAADPGTIDSTVMVGDSLRRIVGVMPEGVTFPRWSDVWIPATPALFDPVVNDMTLVRPFALRKENISETAASEEIASLMNRMRQQYPLLNPEQLSDNERNISETDSGFVTTLPQRNMHDLGNQITFFVLGILSIILFLLACINVGTLLLARTNERLKDLSIRVALGAPRMRLLIQTMGESILIALVGTVFAILLAGLCLEGMNLFLTTLLAEEGIEFWWNFGVDGFTLLLASLFAVASVLVTSAWPAWKLINGNFNSVMQDGTRGALGLRTGRFNKSLVVAAIALISVFLYAFIAVMSVLWSVGGTSELIDPEGMYSVEIQTTDQFDSMEERLTFYQTLQGSLQDHPDVDEVFLVGETGIRALEIDGVTYLSDQEKPTAPVQIYSGDLNILGTTLLEGRLFTDGDNQESLPVAMVSRSLADDLWSGESAIGERLGIGNGQGGSNSYTVVGVTSDTPIDGTDLFNQQYDMVYLPLGQMDSTQLTAVVRSDVPPQAATKILADVVFSLNSDVFVDVLSWVDNIQEISFVVVSGLVVFTVIGVFAFLVSIAGIFGLTKNSILLRTQEIGTRRALGAADRAIGRTFLRQGARQAITGIAIAVLICAPFAYIVYSLAGPGYILPGLMASAVALVLFFTCMLSTIYYPIQTELRKEPAELLRYQ